MHSRTAPLKMLRSLFAAMLALACVAGLVISPTPAVAGLPPADAPTFHWVATWGAPAAPGELNAPADIAVDAAGNVYIADTGNHRIQVLTADGVFLRTFGRLGRGDGEFYNPQGIAVRGDRVYVADRGNSRVQVFTLNGDFVRQIGRWVGFAPGSLWAPFGVGADAAGRAYVLDPAFSQVQRFTADGAFDRIYEFSAGTALAVTSVGDFYDISYRVERVSSTGEIQPVGADPAQPGYLRSPYALTVADDDSLWVYDLSGGLVNHYSAGGVYLGNFPVESGVVALAASNDRLFVLTGAPQVVTYDLAGNRLDTWGTSAVFRFDHPDRLATAPDGTFYVLERSRRRIQHLDDSGNTLAVLGTGVAAQGNLVSPQDIAVDALGRLYVLDDSWQTRVVRFTGDRFDTSFATGAVYASTSAPVAAIATTSDMLLLMTEDGAVLRTDLAGGRIGEWVSGERQKWYQDLAVIVAGRAYRINQYYVPTVKATTLLGAPLFSWGEVGYPEIGPSKFVLPTGIAADLRGRLFVVDTDNRNTPGYAPVFSSRVQVFDEQGQYLTAWGSFGNGPGQFANPQAVAALSDGRIVVADTRNNRLQVFAADGPLPPYHPLPGPTPFNGAVTPPLNVAWQDLSPAGLTSASGLLFPPINGGVQPVVALYADGAMAQSTDDGAHWTRLPDQLRGHLLAYAGRGTLIAQPSWADAPYRSDDWGRTWTRLGDAIAGGPVQIAASPTFDDDGILFASAYGSGFWRSTDRGDTWQLRSLKGGRLSPLATALTADGRRVLFLGNYGDATPVGLLRSTDDGLTWQATHRTPNSIFVSPTFSQDQTVFDLIWTVHEDGIGRSNDGGLSWQQVGIGSLPSDSQVSWRGLILSPQYATDHTLLLWSRRQQYSGGYYDQTYQVYRSTDAGETWTTFGPETANILQFLAFSPTYAQDHRIWRSEAGSGDRFQFSTDDGASWQPAGSLPGVNLINVAVSEWAGTTPVWAVTPDGVLAADSAGNSWSWLRAFTTSRPMRTAALARSPAFERDGAALAFNVATTDGGRSWQPWVTDSNIEVTYSSAAAYAPDFATSSIAVAAWDDYSAGGYVAVSTDGGATWNWNWRAPPGLAPAAIAFAARWPADPTLYVGGEGGLAASTDLGSTWQQSGGPVAELNVVGLANMTEGNQSILYAATSTRGVWRSADSGITWAAFNASLPNGHACRLAHAADLLAVGLCDGNVYLWQPNLNAWQRVGDAPPGGVTALALQRGRSEGIAWVGTGSGVYRTTFPAAELTPRMRFPLLPRNR